MQKCGRLRCVFQERSRYHLKLSFYSGVTAALGCMRPISNYSIHLALAQNQSISGHPQPFTTYNTKVSLTLLILNQVQND